ncbi:hypothetical protein B6A42_27095 (plasmid) [Vibrio coralliilyticus]|nr:hypothetical protein B6A42_27095 [Vibrio coralliilyticus]
MKFAFLHKDNCYTVIKEENHQIEVEAQQLKKQGFVAFTQCLIEAEDEHTAKHVYLKRLLFGVSGSCVFCLYKETGMEVWRTKLTSSIAVPSVYNSFSIEDYKIYISFGGHIVCLCAFSGLEIWKNEHKIIGSSPISLFSY